MPHVEQREAPAPSIAPALSPSAGPLTVGGVLGLQRSVGNCAATRALGRSMVAPTSPAAPAAPSPGALERALAQAAAARVDRCPDCGGTCTCEEETEEAEQPADRRLAPLAKALGDAPEFAAGVPAAPGLVEGDLAGGEPEAPETGAPAAAPAEGAPAAAPAEGAPAAVAATPPSEVDAEVIDESPDEDLDDGPEPEADETPDPEFEAEGGQTVARSAVNLGSAPPAHALDAAGAYAALAKASVSMKSAAAASIPLGAGIYGLTFPESVDVKFTAVRSGANWVPRVSKLTGRYSMQIRLLPGQSEVTGPKGNTTSANFCSQVTGLTTLGNTVGNTWYMLKAVKRHEQVHKTRFVPALKARKGAIVTSLEAASVPHVAGMNKAAAIAAINLDPTFQAAVTGAQAIWLAEILTRVAGDHAGGGPTDKAEHKIVDPMVKAICKTAKKKKWPACADCPP